MKFKYYFYSYDRKRKLKIGDRIKNGEDVLFYKESEGYLSLGNDNLIPQILKGNKIVTDEVIK